MENNWISAIGLMSGTSLDGLDIAYCKFRLDNDHWDWKLEAAETIPYESEMKRRLKQAYKLETANLCLLDIDLGIWMGQQCASFITKNSIKPSLIASHGHTIFHQPDKQLTVQIGNLNALYNQINVPVINNFRELDVLKGGQGAPLVPVGDQLLFPSYSYCLNLGGIANISYNDKNGMRTAFDISVCNIGLNYLANKFNLDFDLNGQIAEKGKVNSILLEELNNQDYYKKTGPKSLGREDIERDLITLLEYSTAGNEDKMATLVEHISVQVVKVLSLEGKKEGKILITGGGALNRALLECIQGKLPKAMELVEVDRRIIEFKEAIIFAFLGVLRAINHVNIYSSVTGASSDSIAGDMIGKVCI